MKRKLLAFGCILGAALFTNDLQAQINYSEDFEGTINWSGSDFFQSNDVPCEGNSSFVSDLHGGFVPDGSDATVSPTIGTSTGSLVTLVYHYKVLNSQNSQPALNSANWGSISIAWGTSATGPWTTLETMNPANHVQSATCAERTVTFTPAAGSQVYIRFFTELNDFSNFLHLYVDDITATQTCDTPDAPEADATQTLCEGATVADLEATGNIVWYTGETGGAPLPETTVLSDNGIYYAAQITGGCESDERTEVTVDLTVVDAPQVLLIDQIFCQGEGTLGDIQVGAQGDVVWYETETSDTPLDADTLINNTVYYATQIVDGCESPQRTGIPVILNITPTPTGDATQEFINSDSEELFLMPFSEIDVETADGATITWYTSEEDAENGENGHTEDDLFTEGGTYYVTQTIDGCESAPFAVTVDVILSSEDFLVTNLKIYPNPVNHLLAISYTEDITSVAVYNMLGQQVLYRVVNAKDVQIDMSQLAAGTYMAKIATAGAVKMFKVIKQ